MCLKSMILDVDFLVIYFKRETKQYNYLLTQIYIFPDAIISNVDKIFCKG